MKNRKLMFLSALLICIFALSISICAATESFTPGSTAKYYVSNSGSDSNSGTSASAPLKTLSQANAYLKTYGGGTIVICGDVNISSAYTPIDVGGAVVYTSTNSAKLIVGANIAFSSDTYFDDINLHVNVSASTISGHCNNLGFGDGVKVTLASTSYAYPNLVGGWNNPTSLTDTSNAKDYALHIYGGTWNTVTAGNRRTSGTAHAVSSLRGDISLVIKGGTFKSVVSGTGMSVHTKRMYVDISGGTFEAAVYPISRLGTMPDNSLRSAHEFTADVLVRISGGTFKDYFRLAQSTISTTATTYMPIGNATVVIKGGSFAKGIQGFGVAGSTILKYDANALDVNSTYVNDSGETKSKIDGFTVLKSASTATSSTPTEYTRFTNRMSNSPDPYVIEKDGIYYYCYSTGRGVAIAAHGNVPFASIPNQARTVFDYTDTTNTYAQYEYWAPELHYFSASDVGSANAGWYIYFAADDGTNANHRMYVAKATDPENPLSDYEYVGKISSSDDHWAIDGTVAKIGGKFYFIWSGWEGTSTTSAQRLYIAQMSSPTTISSARVEISYPDQWWEHKNSNYINEGPQIIQNGGKTFIVYSASASWLQDYCYGVLTLTGSNPLSASSWTKYSDQVFSSGNEVYGPGHGCFVQDHNDEWWMLYHGVNDLYTSDWWSARGTYAQKFTFDSNGFPNFGSPAAHGTTQYIDTPTADYHASGDHFYSPVIKTVDGTTIKLIKTCEICGTKTMVAGVSVPSVSVKPTDNSSITVTITPSVSGATNYTIYRSTSATTGFKQIAKSTSTTYKDTDTVIGTTYYYKVKQNKEGAYGSHATYGTLSSSLSAATDAVTAAPSAVPVQLYYDGEIVKLTWSANADAVKYKVFRRVSGESSWDDVSRMTTETTYTDSTITVGTTYDYAVQAWATSGDAYCYSAISDVIETITATALDTPVLTVKNTVDGISISVEAISDANGYKFYRSTNATSGFTQIEKTTATSFTDTTAKAGTAYYYQVRAYKQSGNVVNYSALPTATAMVRLESIVPTLEYVGSTVMISWEASSTAEKYRVFRRVSGTSSWDLTVMVTDTTYADTTAVKDTTYEYAVQNWTPLGDGYCYSALKTVVISTKPVFEESTAGDTYTAIANRANGGSFTMLERNYNTNTTSEKLIFGADALPSGAYIYCVNGDFITRMEAPVQNSDGTYTVTVPFENSDAVIFSEVSLVTYGDTNSDGRFTLIDVIKILKLSINETTTADKAAADMTGDLKINILDAMSAIRAVLN